VKDIDYKFISKKIGFFRFKKLDEEFLLTTDNGDFIFLKEEEFRDFLYGKLPSSSSLYIELRKKGFIKDSDYFDTQVEQYRNKNMFLWRGPVLHIVVLTLRCNYNCLYCQSDSRFPNEKGYDMDKDTAKKVVDIIFQAPHKFLTIEFQGGEPLLNFEILSFVIEYAREKSMKTKKNVEFTLVSNLSLLNLQILEYLKEKNVSICTSLDGPSFLHNRYRIFWRSKKDTYLLTTQKIRLLKRKGINVNALLTLTKESLKYPHEIIDEYIKYGFREIHLRPLTFLGRAKRKKRLMYSPSEFLKFYSQALDYLIELNLKGKTKLKERTAKIFLIKILKKMDPNYMDLRSPCGAGIGQILYNYNGEVFTCDEARMLKDKIFKIGNVKKDDYNTIIESPAVFSCCVASTLESSVCDYCAYKPYCGICPVINYDQTGNLFLRREDLRCRINKGVLDYLFRKLKNKKEKEVLEKWIEET
jgi:His-Xaa-Ser system radical SAM maturase HxsB